MIAQVVANKVRENPLIRLKDVMVDCNVLYGLTLGYFHAWLGVEKERTELYGDYALSFDQLCWYIGVALNTNTGSRFHLDCDPMSRCIKRVFVEFQSCIEGFTFCQPLLFVDGTFLKRRYKGTLLVTQQRMEIMVFLFIFQSLLNCWFVWLRNREIFFVSASIFPLPCVVVDSETGDNWSWFLQTLSQILSHERDHLHIRSELWS